MMLRQKAWTVLSLLLFFCLYGVGGQESWQLAATKVAPSNTIQELQDAHFFAVQVLQTELLAKLNTPTIRSRSQQELDAVVLHERFKAREAAAKTLSDLLDKRDALLFAGLEDWKYKKEFASLTSDIAEAREKFQSAETALDKPLKEIPLVIAKENLDGTFKDAPKETELRSFCFQAKIDALLRISATSWYGRLRLDISLYSPYLDKDLHRERHVVSLEGLQSLLPGIVGRLRGLITESRLVALNVDMPYEGAELYLDGQRIYPEEYDKLLALPGSREIEVYARGYESAKLTQEFKPGEEATVRIILEEQRKEEIILHAFDSDGQEREGVEVREGASFLGLTPLTLQISIYEDHAYSLRAADGKIASIFIPRGTSGKIAVTLIPPLDSSVEKERSKFYTSFGRFSLALPVTWLVAGMAQEYYVANKQMEAMIATGAALVVGGVSAAFLGESIYRFVRYLKQSNDSAVRKAKIQRQIDIETPAVVEYEEYE